jgi:cytochrome c-type biogenesis protein CcmH
MALWLVLAAMTLLAGALVALPFIRRSGAVRARAEYDAAVYRDQLREIDRDLAEGIISAADADAARIEVGRRLIAATDATPKPTPAKPTTRAARRAQARNEPAPPAARPAWTMAAALAVGAPVVALAVYLTHGSPGLPSVPAATRIANAPPAATGERSEESLVAELARRMQERPDDVRGWALLGRSLVSLGRGAEAVEAFERAVALQPGDADLQARLGEANLVVSEGVVNEAARRAFEAALAADPKEPRSRFYLGVAELQAGNERAALDRWVALETDSPPNAPWRPQLAQRIDALAHQIGVDPATLRPAKDPSAPRGPSAADVAAAQQMTPEERMTMIRSMVESLASRLEAQPDDVEGWLRLARSYGVLGEAERSRDAYGRAAKLRPDDLKVQSAYAESLYKSAGDGMPPAELADVLSHILTRDPANRDALWLSGLAASRAGDAASARTQWQKLLAQISPGSTEYAALKKRMDSLATN